MLQGSCKSDVIRQLMLLLGNLPYSSTLLPWKNRITSTLFPSFGKPKCCGTNTPVGFAASSRIGNYQVFPGVSVSYSGTFACFGSDLE